MNGAWYFSGDCDIITTSYIKEMAWALAAKEERFVEWWTK